MKITTLSSLTLATVALALCATTEAKAVTGCAASKALTGLTTFNAPTEGAPTAGLGSIPDAQALAKAVGSFGAVATLIAGGTLLYRRRQTGDVFADEALADGSLAKADLGVDVQAESVLVAEDVLVEETWFEAVLTAQDMAVATEAEREEPALSLSR